MLLEVWEEELLFSPLLPLRAGDHWGVAGARWSQGELGWSQGGGRTCVEAGGVGWQRDPCGVAAGSGCHLQLGLPPWRSATDIGAAESKNKRRCEGPAEKAANYSSGFDWGLEWRRVEIATPHVLSPASPRTRASSSFARLSIFPRAAGRWEMGQDDPSPACGCLRSPEMQIRWVRANYLRREHHHLPASPPPPRRHRGVIPACHSIILSLPLGRLGY